MSRFRYWLSGPQGALVYFGTCYTLVVIGFLLLSGCITYEDRVTIDAIVAEERARNNTVNAELACKALARNLVQVARCDVRR